MPKEQESTKYVPIQSHEYVKRIKKSIERHKRFTNQSRLTKEQKDACVFFAVPYQRSNSDSEN